jgi:hypothetical protein
MTASSRNVSSVLFSRQSDANAALPKKYFVKAVGILENSKTQTRSHDYQSKKVKRHFVE